MEPLQKKFNEIDMNNENTLEPILDDQVPTLDALVEYCHHSAQQQLQLLPQIQAQQA